MKLHKILLNNIGLKLMALVLALLTWFYIQEATKLDSERTVLQRLLSAPPFVSKKLYIKPNFIGETPEGYTLLTDDVKVTPEFILVVGPSDVLGEKEFLYTKPIDLREYTISKTIEMELGDISRSLRFKRTKVQVYLPVKQLKKQQNQ